MTLLQILKRCRENNIALSTEQGRLIIKSPDGEIEPELHKAIKAAKSELISLVAPRAADQLHQGAKVSSLAKDPILLSPYQLPFWRSQQSDESEQTIPVIIEAFDFDIPLDLHTMQKALDWTAGRHAMLRTIFAEDSSGEVHQTVLDAVSVQLVEHLVPEHTHNDKLIHEHEHDQAVKTLISKLTNTPYDPGHDTPLRAGIVNGQKKGTLILSIPHMAGDAASLEVILNDLLVYMAHVQQASPLPGEHPTQYFDHQPPANPSQELSQTKNGIDFWVRQLRGLPPVHGLPTDFARPTDRKDDDFDFLMLPLPFSNSLRNILKNKKISPFVYLHTALRILLYRFGNIHETPIITPMANRNHLPDPNTVVGCFANEVALNIPLNPEESIEDALLQTRNHLAESLDYQGVPFTEVVRAVGAQRTRDWLPVSQIFFSYLGLASNLPVQHRFDHIRGLNYDLSFVVADRGEQMKFMLGYDKRLYRRETVEHLAALYSCLCSSLHESIKNTPANLTLGNPQNKVSTKTSTEERLKEILAISSKENILFVKNEDAPVLDIIRQTASMAGATITTVDDGKVIKDNNITLVVTTSHPAQLKKTLRGRNTKKLRIVIVNNLPTAPALREIAQNHTNGLLLLELPTNSTEDTQDFATVSFETCRSLQGNERFIACKSDRYTGAPGESLNLGKNLISLVASPGTIHIPLPSPTTGHIWHGGKAIDLDALAVQWGGESVALSFSACPVSETEPDKLTAWLAPDAEQTIGSRSLQDIGPGLPTDWPNYRVAVSSLPLTQRGKVDRNVLDHLPLTAPEVLESLAMAYSMRHDCPLALQAESHTPTSKLVHYSQLIPNSEHLTIEGEYTPLDLDTASKGHSPAPPSLSEGPPLQQTMNISFRDHMERFQDRELVFIDINGKETTFSGRAFLKRARVLLHAMQKSGLQPEDKVIVYCSEERDLYVLAWACLLGGICMSGLIPPVGGQSPEPIHTRLGHMHKILGEPPVITTRGEYIPMNGAAIHRIEDLFEVGKSMKGDPTHHLTQKDTLVYTAFTSGSTGAPKGVPLTAHNVFSMIYAKIQTIGSIENETAFSMTALDHVASLFCNSIYSTVCGARQVYCSFQYVLADPKRILDIIHRYRVSHTWAPDFTWRQLYESLRREEVRGEWDLSCLRHIISAAENTREATFKNIEEALRPYGMPPRVLLHSWGMSETSSLLTMSDYWNEKSHQGHKGIIDAGRPMAGFSFRVADKTGIPVPQGSIGSFQVRGGSVLSGYYNNPKANAESFTKDGWFITGDLAMLKDGKVVFCGREKEQVVIKGQNIAQFDIEGFVDGIEGVEPTFSVVIGCKNEKTGDDDILVFAHTKLTAPKDRAAVIRRINATLAANFGVLPAQIILVEEEDVPKALLGKIQRTNILKRFLKGEFYKQVLEADMLLENEKTIPNWFACKGWTHAELHGSNHSILQKNLPRNLIIMTGSEDVLGKTIISKLNTHSVKIPTKNLKKIREFNPKTLELTPKQTLIFLLDREPEEYMGSKHASWRRDSFIPLYSFMQFLATQEQSHGNVMIVTTNGQAVGSEPTRVWTATLTGLAASLARESSTNVRLIDIAGESAKTDAEAVLREFTEGGTAPISAWRKGKRLIPTLHAIRKNTDNTGRDWTTLFDSRHYCLCTGMTGHLGRELLPQLLLTTNGNFLIVGRKLNDEALALFEKHCSFIPQWDKRIYYAQASLDNEQSLQNAMQSATHYFSEIKKKDVTPGGLLHLANDTKERSFHHVSNSMLVEGLMSRLNHMKNIETAFSMAGGSGPRIVFSSVLSFWGGGKSALYAPGCALVETYVHNHRLKASNSVDTWHCFMWSRWKDASESEDLIARLMEKRGFMTIDLKRGVLSLFGLLNLSAQGEKEMLVAGIDTKNPHISKYIHTPGHKIHTLKKLGVHVLEGAHTASLNAFLRKRLGRNISIRLHELSTPKYDGQGKLLPGNNASTERVPTLRGKTEPRMAAIWRKVLQRSHIGPSASFFELGGTSVLVPRLRKQVQEEFNVDIGSVGIFDYPTIREMSQAIDNNTPNNTEAMSSAAARAAKQRKARRVRQ